MTPNKIKFWIRLHGFVVIMGATCFMMTSCIKEFPETFPTEYEWKPEIALPLGNIELGLKEKFGYDSLLLETDTITGHSKWAELPEITIQGSFDYNFSEVLRGLEGIEKVILRVNVFNGFPMEFDIQSHLIDSQDRIVDSLFNPVLQVKRGSISGGGKTETPSFISRDIVFEGEEIFELHQVREVSISATIPTLPYFPEYSFRVQLGAVIIYRTDFPLD